MRTKLAGLSLDSATSSGLGRTPRSAMQDPIQAPPGTTRQKKIKLEQCSLSKVGLWSGREKKKREIGMARKRAENREGSLGFPGFVKPVFTKDSKPLGRRKRSLGHLGSVKPVLT
ncbi:hypothetical protein TNCV_830261 [Trichonephila clavipes]|nr:hypothetical protein TNCV_830261 [Trichonephila clavipes]